MGHRGGTRDEGEADTCGREIKVERIAAQIKGWSLVEALDKKRVQAEGERVASGGRKDGRRATHSRPWAPFTLQV